MTERPMSAPDVELGFLGSCFMSANPAEWADVQRTITAECFTHAKYREAWTLISEAWTEGHAADVLTVAAQVAAKLGEDGPAIMLDLTGAIEAAYPGTAMPRAQLLRKLATRRALVAFGTETAQHAFSEDDLAGVLAYTARVAELIDEMDARDETGEVAPIADEVERIAESGQAQGWPTGIPHVDSWTGGIRPGEVVVVGGPSGAGKTWLLAQIATALAPAHRVAFVTLEMGKDEIYIRLLASMIGLKAYRMAGRGRTWEAGEYDEYRAAKAKLTGGNLRIYADQRSTQQVARMVRATVPNVVLVDYVQLLDWPGGATSEYDALTRSMNDLQRLAKRSRCAMVLATQQSRAVQMNRNTSVQGGMGSGRIDQVADLWLLIQAGEGDGELTLTCRKNRHGPTGDSATYHLDGKTGRMVPG